jgi:hypothetical protein
MSRTVKRINKLKKPGRYGDGHGLYLQVASPTNRSWLLRYERGAGSRGSSCWTRRSPRNRLMHSE